MYKHLKGEKNPALPVGPITKIFFSSIFKLPVYALVFVYECCKYEELEIVFVFHGFR